MNNFLDFPLGFIQAVGGGYPDASIWHIVASQSVAAAVSFLDHILWPVQTFSKRSHLPFHTKDFMIAAQIQVQN